MNLLIRHRVYRRRQEDIDGAFVGGRQQRDLSFTYPNLQERLDAIGMSLFLIADGS